MAGSGSRSCSGFTGGLEGAGEVVEDGDGGVEIFLVVAREESDLVGKGLDAAVAGLEEQALAFHGCGEVNGAAVFGAGFFFDEAFGFEGADDAGHGGRTNPFGIRELAEGEGTGEDDDGERG